MSGPDRLLRAVVALLRRPTPKPDVPSATDRAIAIVAMERARSRMRRRATMIRIGVPAAAAAAALVAVLGGRAWKQRHDRVAFKPTAVPASSLDAAVARTLEGNVVIVRSGKELAVGGGLVIEPGDRVLATEGARAGLSLPTGTHLLVDHGGDLAFLASDTAQTFFLGAGAVRADVAKLRAGERFVVRTSDVEVEVRGTSFRVERVAPSPSCGAGVATRVTVFEGVVTVRSGAHEEQVVAGERWPRCGSVTTPTVSAPALSASGAPSLLVKGTTASDLAAQNNLYGAAMSAKQRGELAAAVAGFERLLSRYPSCALAEQATVERMKLLAKIDRARGVAAAKAYLTRYPKGYARIDAQAIVEKGP